MQPFINLDAVKNMPPKTHLYSILPSGIYYVPDAGFYFSDECEQWQGPFMYEYQAIKASIEWCNQLNSYYVDATWRIYRDFGYNNPSQIKVICKNNNFEYNFYIPKRYAEYPLDLFAKVLLNKLEDQDYILGAY